MALGHTHTSDAEFGCFARAHVQHMTCTHTHTHTHTPMHVGLCFPNVALAANLTCPLESGFCVYSSNHDLVMAVVFAIAACPRVRVRTNVRLAGVRTKAYTNCFRPKATLNPRGRTVCRSVCNTKARPGVSSSGVFGTPAATCTRARTFTTATESRCTGACTVFEGFRLYHRME